MFKKNRNNESLFAIITGCLHVFYPAKKKEFHFLLFVTFMASVIDVMSFTSVIPVIYLINNPDPIRMNPILHSVYVHLSFHSNGNFILFLLVCLALVFILKNILLLGCTYIQNKFIFQIAYDLTERQLNRFYNIDFLDIRKSNITEYIRYLAIAPQEFAVNILYPLTLAFYEIMVVILIVFGFLLYYPLILLLIVISIGPLSYIFLRITRKKLALISQTKGAVQIEAFSGTMEGIQAYTDIRLFNKQQVFIDSIKARFSILYEMDKRLSLYQWFPRRIIETLVILTVCVLYALTSVVYNMYPAKVVIILLTFATAAYRLMPSVNEILANIVKIKTSRYVLHHLGMMNDAAVGPETENYAFHEKIEFCNIGFRYENDKAVVLDNINFTIQKGAFVVITGESGSGKTTIGKILTGFVKPLSGSYRIDGKEVTHFNQVKELMGYVTQDFYLFNRSFLENIAVGEDPEKIDMERIGKVIRAANLSEFISSFPSGIHYVIGEMGAKLSGGQKQRIAIARALYKQAQILVLDEITSSLDLDNEMEILDTIYTIARNEKLTVIIITHRLASLNRYDARYDLENGHLTLKS